MASVDLLERHDRTLRFVQQVIPWRTAPSHEALLDTAARLCVTIEVPSAAGRPQLQLAALAATNVIGRLPLGRLRVAVGPVALELRAAPYRGSTLSDSLGDLSSRLEIDADLTSGLGTPGLVVEIATPWETMRWAIGLDGPKAFLGRSPAPSTDRFHPVGCYAAASMVGGEVIRTWARGAAATGAGVPGDRFEARTAPTADRWLDLLDEGEPLLPLAPLPAVDWVSCGAVNQAVLAVLAACQEFTPTGTIFDPGHLDAPDLNRSLLSFPADIGRPKAHTAAVALGSLAWRLGHYPEGLDTSPASWIVCGTDDPSARPACQRLWPQRLVVTATEDVFGYAAWHGPDHPDVFCAACQPAPPLTGGGPIPTSAPSSVVTGAAAAALLLRLAAGEAPSHRTDLLSLRLDSPLAVERSDPPATPECPVCGAPSTASGGSSRGTPSVGP